MGIEFSDRELTIMELLWERDSCTVREAKDALEDDLAYTSVLSAFQNLEEKGRVTHDKEGRAYRYRPTVSREEAQKSALSQIVDRLFGGSKKAALTSLMESGAVDEDVLERARREIEESDDE